MHRGTRPYRRKAVTARGRRVYRGAGAQRFLPSSMRPLPPPLPPRRDQAARDMPGLDTLPVVRRPPDETYYTNNGCVCVARSSLCSTSCAHCFAIHRVLMCTHTCCRTCGLVSLQAVSRINWFEAPASSNMSSISRTALRDAMSKHVRPSALRTLTSARRPSSWRTSSTLPEAVARCSAVTSLPCVLSITTLLLCWDYYAFVGFVCYVLCRAC